jgi:hypothetical protein
MIKSKSVRFMLLAFLFGAFSAQITMSMDEMLETDRQDKQDTRKAKGWAKAQVGFKRIANRSDISTETPAADRLSTPSLSRVDSSVHLDTDENPGELPAEEIRTQAVQSDNSSGFFPRSNSEEIDETSDTQGPDNTTQDTEIRTPDEDEILRLQDAKAKGQQNEFIDDIKAALPDNLSRLPARSIETFLKLVDGDINQLSPAQIDALTREQLEAALKVTSLPNDVKAKLQKLLDLKSSKFSRIGDFFRNRSMKNAKRAWASDKEILQSFLQDQIQNTSTNPSNIDTVNKDAAKRAIAKLSRTGRLELINDMTRAEINDFNKKNSKMTQTWPEHMKRTTTTAIFERNIAIFRDILPKTDIITFTHDKKNTAASYKFQIADMADFKYDPSLSIEANAKLLRQQQNLDINVTDVDKKDPNYKGSAANLSTYIKEYLKKQDTPAARHALMVDALQTTPIHKLNENTELKEYFKTASPDLISKMFTDATMAPINAEEIQYGTKLPSTHVEELFKHNAVEYQTLLPENLALIPTKGKYGPPSFEIIDLSKISDHQIQMLENLNSLDAQDRMPKLTNLAKDLKFNQKLNLSTADIVDFLIKEYAVKLSRPEEIWKNIDRTELRNITDEKLQTLRAEDIASLGDKINDLRIESLRILSDSQCNGLTPTQINDLTTLRLQIIAPKLTAKNLRIITKKQLESLPEDLQQEITTKIQNAGLKRWGKSDNQAGDNARQ